MPGESSGRPLLPQTAQMQSYTFAPPTLAPRENQRSEFGRRDAPQKMETHHAAQITSSWTSITGTSASKVRRQLADPRPPRPQTADCRQ